MASSSAGVLVAVSEGVRLGGAVVVTCGSVGDTVGEDASMAGVLVKFGVGVGDFAVGVIDGLGVGIKACAVRAMMVGSSLVGINVGSGSAVGRAVHALNRIPMLNKSSREIFNLIKKPFLYCRI